LITLVALKHRLLVNQWYQQKIYRKKNLSKNGALSNFGLFWVILAHYGLFWL